MVLSTATALPSEASWGDTMRAYDRDRRAPAWERLGKGMPPKDSRVTHRDKRGVYDPVLSRMNEPVAERALLDQESAQRALKIAQARERQAVIHPYDIVTHTRRLDGDPAPNKYGAYYGRPGDSRTSWNIVTHQRTGRETAPGQQQQQQQQQQGDVSKNAQGGLLPSSWQRREYDIVSNKYLQGHGDRERTDRVAAKREAERKFWATHEYDAVLGKYYDADRERAFEAQRRDLEAAQGCAALAKLPPCVQYCEGAAYDIVSHSTKDTRKLEVTEGVGNRTVSSKMGASVELEIRARAAAKADLDDGRFLCRFARTADLRDRDQGRQRGYDVLTGEAFDGRNAKAQPPSLIPRKTGAWQVLTHGAPAVAANYTARSSSSTATHRQRRTRDLTGTTNRQRTAPAPGPPPQATSSARGQQQQQPQRPIDLSPHQETAQRQARTSAPRVPALSLPPPDAD